MRKLWIGLLALTLCACNMEEMKQLQQENEQLKAALGESNDFAEGLNDKMNQIDVLMDSIESAEKSLTISLAEGTDYDDYAARLRNVKDYIDDSKNEISKLEKSLSKSLSKNKIFMRQIRNLKKQVAEREETIIQLSEQVEKFREENTALVKTVDLQKGEILAQERLILDKKKELAVLEANIESMKEELATNIANAFYEQAEINVQLAEKTKLAPKKKRQHYQDAHDLFQKAFEAGREDAFARMEELKEKINK